MLEIERRVTWKQWCKLTNVVRGPDRKPRVPKLKDESVQHVASNRHFEDGNRGLAIGF